MLAIEQQTEPDYKPALPPRPINVERMNNLSKPRPKADDPELRPEPKHKKASRMTRKQLQERANRVKIRQEQAMQAI